MSKCAGSTLSCREVKEVDSENAGDGLLAESAEEGEVSAASGENADPLGLPIWRGSLRSF